MTTEPESASNALSEAAILHDADEDGNSVSDMMLREISERHDEAEEAAEYSVDLSEEPETVSPESTPISSTEESDWGFQEPKKEITEEKGLEPPLEAPVPAGRSKIAPKSDRQLFYELKFNNLDRGLPPGGTAGMELHLCLLPRTQCYHRYDYRRRPAFYLCVEPGDRETREKNHVLRHCGALPCTHCNSSLGNVGIRK